MFLWSAKSDVADDVNITTQKLRIDKNRFEQIGKTKTSKYRDFKNKIMKRWSIIII